MLSGYGYQQICRLTPLNFFRPATNFSIFCLLSSQLDVWGSPFFGWDFCISDHILSNHRGSHIPSLWMVLPGCVFFARIHLSRTWLWSFESVRWNAWLHRLDLDVFFNPKELNTTEWSQNLRQPQEKNPLNWMDLRRMEPAMLQQTAQRAQHNTNSASLAPYTN